MRVFIQVQGEESAFPLVVECGDTIASVKEKVFMMIGVAPQHQVLTYADWQLTDVQTLVETNIQHRATIQVSTRKPEEVPVSADGYESGGTEIMEVDAQPEAGRRRVLRPTHSTDQELPPSRTRTEAPLPSPLPAVDAGNPVEVALQKFGLTTLAQVLTEKQDHFETYMCDQFRTFEKKLSEQPIANNDKFMDDNNNTKDSKSYNMEHAEIQNKFDKYDMLMSDEAMNANVMIEDPVLHHLFIDVWEMYAKEVRFLQMKGIVTLKKIKSQ